MNLRKAVGPNGVPSKTRSLPNTSHRPTLPKVGHHHPCPQELSYSYIKASLLLASACIQGKQMTRGYHRHSSTRGARKQRELCKDALHKVQFSMQHIYPDILMSKLSCVYSPTTVHHLNLTISSINSHNDTVVDIF